MKYFIYNENYQDDQIYGSTQILIVAEDKKEADKMFKEKFGDDEKIIESNIYTFYYKQKEWGYTKNILELPDKKGIYLLSGYIE